MTAWWSWLLTAVGVTGLWLAGRPRTRGIGWSVGLAAQVLWVAYATASRQWGFYVSAAAYGTVYARNVFAEVTGWHTTGQRAPAPPVARARDDA
jgi:hypothetical protein